MPRCYEHPPRWMPTKALHDTPDLAPELLYYDPVPNDFNDLVDALLSSGTPEIVDYAGYPDVQRSVAEEMATLLLQTTQRSADSSNHLNKATTNTQYIVSSEPLLFHRARQYGVNSRQFSEAVDKYAPEVHTEAINRAIESPGFRRSDETMAFMAVDALTKIVSERASAAESMAKALGIDYMASRM